MHPGSPEWSIDPQMLSLEHAPEGAPVAASTPKKGHLSGLKGSLPSQEKYLESEKESESRERQTEIPS